MYEAFINAIQKAIGYEKLTKILADNPASMFQVAQTMLDTAQTPIFIILERAHELACSWLANDSEKIILINSYLQHFYYDRGSKMISSSRSQRQKYHTMYSFICLRYK